MQLLLVALLLVPLFSVGDAGCPRTSATADTKPLYLLTLASIPDGLRVLSGARVARDEVNNRTDLLPGYHIELIVDTIEECSSFEAGIGLSNLVKYTVSPPCRPVVAVNGLGCSSHTSVLSPVAGHDGYDLIQLSSANSPIFQTQNHRFPHLWRFSGSATLYSDVVLALMDQYNWTGIGVVFDVDSAFNSGIASDLQQKIKESTDNQTIKFALGVRKTIDYYLDAVVSHINSTQAFILVSLLNMEQREALLSRVSGEGFVYPRYTWIHIEASVKSSDLDVTQGHIFLHTKTSLESNTVLVSGETFGEFERKLSEDIKLIEQQYKHYNLTPSVFASTWYDQVWAMALAVNNSLPVLGNRNLSIDNYTIGQHEITDVIEEQMANLSFQGADGWVEFNQYHSVSTPVEVFWISDNTTHKLVGFYNPLNQTRFHVDINSSDLPADRIPKIFIVIPLPVAILFYIIISSVVVFTTIQLILYLHYRNHKVIKATSPYLSLLMFAGCYLCCAAAILLNTIGSFTLPCGAYLTLSILIIVFIVNSASLVFVTLSAKLVRIYRIFSAWMKRDLGRRWNDCPLVCMVLIFAVVPNILLAILLALRPPQLTEVPTVTRRGNVIVEENHIVADPIAIISVYISAVYILIFLVILVYLSITSRKVRIKIFNNSCQVLFLLGVIFVTICITDVLYIVLSLTRQEHLARSIMITGLIIFSLSCQLGLFTTKLVRVLLLENHFSKTHSTFKAMSAAIKQTVFS